MVPPRSGALIEQPSDDVAVRRVREVKQADPQTRERWATMLAVRLDVPMSALGVIFLFVVLGQTVATSPALQEVLAAVGWLLWAVFVAEFALRLYVAPDRSGFLKRNWWQLVFLVVPMLRFLRLVVVLRLARVGRVVSSAVRSSRSAGRLVTSRLAWLGAVSVIVVLASSQLLFAFAPYDSYGDALNASALATITGEPLPKEDGLSQVLEVVLAIYSVGVFGVLAGAFGAYFLHGRESAGAAQPAG